jgi:hypothetical protein
LDSHAQSSTAAAPGLSLTSPITRRDKKPISYCHLLFVFITLSKSWLASSLQLSWAPGRWDNPLDSCRGQLSIRTEQNPSFLNPNLWERLIFSPLEFTWLYTERTLFLKPRHTWRWCQDLLGDLAAVFASPWSGACGCAAVNQWVCAVLLPWLCTRSVGSTYPTPYQGKAIPPEYFLTICTPDSCLPRSMSLQQDCRNAENS